MSENSTPAHAPGGERFQVLTEILESLKKDYPVTISPCGLKLIRCTPDGVEEIGGFEELNFRDKAHVLKIVVSMHEDVFNKKQQVMAKEHADAMSGGSTSKAGMGGLIQATRHDQDVLGVG